jgi:hypothetical protein
MTVSQQNARFCFNNWLDSGAFTSTPAQPDYPTSNLYDPIRSKLWKASLTFEIPATANKFYINGTTKTITPGSYSKSELTIAINALISGIAIIATDDANKFYFDSLTASDISLNISNQANAIWNILGYFGTVDRSGPIVEADEQRASTGEWFKIDLGLPQIADFSAILPEANSVFKMRTSRIRLQGNNLDTWDNPPVDLDYEVSDFGAFIAPNDAQPCRFWRIFIDDKKNRSIEANVLYLGSAVTPTNTNIAVGFTRQREDLSARLISESGALYVDRRPKQLAISGMGVQFLKDEELEEMEQLFYDLGVENPFFLCIDPRKNVSLKLSQMTHYLSVTSPLQLQHVLRGYYNLSVEMREVI